jgi:predicted dinucleotide-binding enzyme
VQITVIGKGNVGGGLATLWELAGHHVTRLGREGGDVSDADVVLVAVPGDAIAEALDGVKGIEGKTVIDATNRYGVAPPTGFASNAEFVKSRVGGPTAKSFNVNFASLYPGSGRPGPGRATYGAATPRPVRSSRRSTATPVMTPSTSGRSNGQPPRRPW